MKRLTEEQKEQLIERVIEIIKDDIACGDLESLYELLGVIPTKNLKAYLPEEL